MPLVIPLKGIYGTNNEAAVVLGRAINGTKDFGEHWGLEGDHRVGFTTVFIVVFEIDLRGVSV